MEIEFYLLSLLLFICLSSTASLRVSHSNRLNGQWRGNTALGLFGSPDSNKNSSPAKKDNGGLFGGMGNLMESMKKAQEIAKQAQVVNKELADTLIVGTDPTGSVTATFNGLAIPIGIKITDAAIALGSEALSAAATQAIIDGHTKSQNLMINKMQALYASSGIPTPPTA